MDGKSETSVWEGKLRHLGNFTFVWLNDSIFLVFLTRKTENVK